MRKGQDTARLWVESGEDKIVQAATVVPTAPIDQTYAYAVPVSLDGKILPGHRVRAPFGRSDRLREGFVTELAQRPWTTTLKHIESVVEAHSWFDDQLLDLARWIARYYGMSLGKTLSAMVPAAVRQQSGFRRVRMISLQNPREAVPQGQQRLGQKQRALLEALPPAGEEIEARTVCRQQGISTATLRSAIKRGWIAERHVLTPQDAPNFDEPIIEPDFELNVYQNKACGIIEEHMNLGEFVVVLVYGVSGSGKTEVYIDAMQRAVKAGQQVIVLVPEIALTTQLVQRFASRFTNVAVLHSGLTGVERSLTWNAIRCGDKRVVIGTRSAVFAPCKDLALIVVDEEQESSFKNQQSPRFHARDVAIKRAQLLKIPIILGSATPALETWYNCQSKDHYTRVHLPERVAGLQLPNVELVDMRQEAASGRGSGLLSALLHKRLSEALGRGEQAVLLLNRRGYAHVLYCPRCSMRVVCRQCQSSMVFHRASDVVMCHQCHARAAVPSHCADPSCGSKLIRLGIGTERVEEEIRRKFPQATLQRVDRDTMENAAKYKAVIAAFEGRKVDILIGTQMVAKGLDFPFVSLVGVISADTALFFPDFRANEMTFQLVTQVAGRAGRGQTGGQVVVQTLMGDLPALTAAMNHDYDAFADRELNTRQELGMPPFRRLTRWILSDPNETRLAEQAERFATLIRDTVLELGLAQVEAIGPFPSPVERIRNRYRYDILLKTKNVEDRMSLLDYLRHEKKWKPRVQRVVIDVDPSSMM